MPSFAIAVVGEGLPRAVSIEPSTLPGLATAVQAAFGLSAIQMRTLELRCVGEEPTDESAAALFAASSRKINSTALLNHLDVVKFIVGKIMAPQVETPNVEELNPRLQWVTFKPVDSITAVRYDNLDAPMELQRPADFDALVARLQTMLCFDPSMEGLSFFPNDQVEAWANNRVRLDRGSFSEWMGLEVHVARLPRVVVYPLA